MFWMMIGNNIWPKKTRHNNSVYKLVLLKICAATQTLDSCKVMRAPHSTHAPSPSAAGTISQTPALERVVLPAFPVSHIWNEQTLQWSKVMRDGSGSVMRSR